MRFRYTEIRNHQDLARPFQRPYLIFRLDQKSVTPSIALRLAKYFGMSADFWMNLQLRWDLYHTQQAESEDLNAIRPHA
jgi:hypothetical protein